MFRRLAPILLATLVALPASAGTTVTKAFDAKTTTGRSSWIPTQDNGKTTPGTVGAVQITLVATGSTTSSVTYDMSPDASTAALGWTFTNIGATPVTVQCSPSPYGSLNYASGTGTISGWITTMAAPNETGGCHVVNTPGTISMSGATGTGALVLATSPTLVTPTLGVASATSLATSAATPLILTQGQAVNVALTSQTVGATTLTIPDFASVVDEFTFKTKAQTLSNKTFVAPALGAATATSLATSAATPLLLTNGQLVNVALTSQSVGATTLTIPDFASVVDEFTFKTKAQTMSNKTFVAPVLGAATGTSLTLSGAATLNGAINGNQTIKALVAATPTAFAKVAVASGSVLSGTVTYSVEADDAVDFQARGGIIPFTAVNKAGTVTCTVGTVSAATEVVTTSAGTLTNAFTCADGTGDTVSLLADAASSLTETTLQIRYRVTALGAGVVTPQ